MLTEFLTWWRDALAELLPARLSGQRSAQDAVLVAPVAGRTDQVNLALRRGKDTRPIGLQPLQPGGRLPASLRRRPRQVVLRLPAAALLGRDLVLPLAAERRLREVVGYEIDRLTPFAAEELFWTCTVRRRDRERGRLHLHLAFIPRIAVQPLLDALGASGLAPAAIEAEEDTTARIDLRGAAAEPGPLARRTEQALAVLCILLIPVVLATPFALQARSAAGIDRQIAVLRPKVEAVEAARRRIAAAAAETDVLAAQRAKLGDPVAVLAALTELLPDDTSLTDLTLRQGKLTIGGQSATAAKLIGLLSSDPLFRNPDFAAPVTRLNDGRADLFSIRAEIAP